LKHKIKEDNFGLITNINEESLRVKVDQGISVSCLILAPVPSNTSSKFQQFLEKSLHDYVTL